MMIILLCMRIAESSHTAINHLNEIDFGKFEKAVHWGYWLARKEKADASMGEAAIEASQAEV